MYSTFENGRIRTSVCLALFANRDSRILGGEEYVVQRSFEIFGQPWFSPYKMLDSKVPHSSNKRRLWEILKQGSRMCLVVTIWIFAVNKNGKGRVTAKWEHNQYLWFRADRFVVNKHRRREVTSEYKEMQGATLITTHRALNDSPTRPTNATLFRISTLYSVSLSSLKSRSTFPILVLFDKRPALLLLINVFGIPDQRCADFLSILFLYRLPLRLPILSIVLF